jgi:hypothetical protein
MNTAENKTFNVLTMDGSMATYTYRPELVNEGKYIRHGGAWDRGSADAYYSRPVNPHYYVGDTLMSEMATELTQDELDAYMTGYYSQDDRKDWR